jgi:hypothetical protein
MKNKLLIALLFVWPFHVFSQNLIYVAPGSSGSGTIENPTSLQIALEQALASPEADIIYLKTGEYLNTSVTMDYNDPLITIDDITISGGWNADYSSVTNDPTLTVLNGNSSRILTINAEDCFGEHMLEFFDLTFANGYVANGHGGAIAVFGSAESVGSVNLNIVRSHFNNNAVEGTGSGGAIFSPYGVNIVFSSFDGNSASNGGAITFTSYANSEENERNVSFSSFKNNSNFGNQGSTIYNGSPNMYIYDSDILGMEDGSSSGNGSAIYSATNSYTNVDRCRFQDIKIAYWGSALQAWNADLDVSNSLFIDCRAGLLSGYGAVAYYHGNGTVDRTVHITNCSFTGNEGQSGSFGSAVHFRGNGGDEIGIANCIFWNQGQNAIYKESGTAEIANSLSDFNPLGFTILTPMINADPLFNDELQIGENSPAVDAGDEQYINENWLDYDGGLRWLGEQPDLGAHEYNAPPSGIELTNLEILENNDPGVLVSSMLVLGQTGDTHSIGLVPGDGNNDVDNDKFEIDLDQLYITESANFEEQDSYSIHIRATDTEGQLVEVDFTISVLDANDAPEYLGGLEDQTGIAGEFNSFEINTDSFTDEDQGDVLSFSATMGNGGMLPDWLSFDPEDYTFSGTPPVEGTLVLKVIATDQEGLEASGTFTYDISPLGLMDVDRQSIKVFPNPATDFIRVDIPEFFCNYAIYTTAGKLMDEGILQGNTKIIDVNKLPTGGYILVIWDERFTRTGKVLIE